MRWFWLFWHPHQKLWNWRLYDGLRRLPGGKWFARLLIEVDTWLLAARCEPAKEPTGPFLYVDCGVHQQGLQVRLMHEWFPQAALIGFEASAEHYEKASAGLADITGLELRQEAVVGPDHQDQTITLYKTGGDGKGDSLFAERGSVTETVPAVRLSSVLADHPGLPVILRMNIEGAELYVIEDLIAAGMLGRVAGFYGMWDDLSKIDPAEDRRFRRLLAEHHIRPITFNDRDCPYPRRLKAIRGDMASQLVRATR